MCLMFWNLLLVSSSSILALRYAFFLFLKCLLTSRLTLFRLSTLLWLGSCIHCILARFLWSKKPKHSSSNQGLFLLNSCRLRLSFAKVWIFSLMFSQVLSTSSSSFKFSTAAHLFVISIWFCSLTSSSFSFLKLNRNKSNLHLPVSNLSVYQKGTYYTGIMVFNSLPSQIKELCHNRNQFKRALKMFLYFH